MRLRLSGELTFPLVSPQPQAAPLASQTGPQDLQDPLQGAGRSGAAGRLLPQPGRLVGGEPAQRGPGSLRLPVECLHQPGELLCKAGAGFCWVPLGSTGIWTLFSSVITSTGDEAVRPVGGWRLRYVSVLE